MLAGPAVVGTLSGSSASPSETQYRYETRTTYETRTRTVKKCFGSYCRYVTETYQVPVTKTVRVPVVASVVAKPSPKPEPAKVQEVSEPNPLKTTELVETPQAVVEAMVATLAIPERGKFFDLGSGDGRLLKTAAQAGAIAVGIELDADRAMASRSGLAGLDALVFTGDVLEYDLAEAEYVSMYLYPELMAKVLPKLSPGASIVSYCHQIPGLENERHSVRVGGEDHVFYFARVPGGVESYVATFGL